MKKTAIYIGLLLTGLLLGWLLFGGNSTHEDNHEHNTETKANQMWTCSMHPQIMKTEPGDCPICGMDLIPAEAGAEGLAADEFKLTENAMKLANIQTTIIGSTDGSENTLKLSGNIVANEKKNAVQVSYFSGRIEELFINFTGEQIKKGQKLATIYSPELFAAQQELLTAKSLKVSQPQLYKAVRNKLKLWKLSDEQINSIEQTGKVIENFPVYATISGTVSEKMVEVGQTVKAGQGLFKIADLNSLWAEFDVYENQISQIKTNQVIEIRTNALPGKVIATKVSFIDPIVNSKTRTVTMRADIRNSNAEFKPGMFVSGTLTLETASETVMVPSSAILWTGKRSLAYVKTKADQPVFEMRTIQIGKKIGDAYEVINGLQSGEEVVSNGAFTVDAAAQLQGKKSMMNQTDETSLKMGMSNQRMKVSAKFQKQLKSVFDAYINLKDALIKGDFKTAKQYSNAMKTHLSKVDMKLLKGDSHNDWMTISKTLAGFTKQFENASEIKGQRSVFKPLSEQLILAIEKYGINQEVYAQFCPMADNDKGGYWLSLEDKILNPYFGDQMLGCGEVAKTIQ
ncbi:MAG: efflux RND transporter periplasmic adaptor subunit [Polaribacter sp.]